MVNLKLYCENRSIMEENKRLREKALHLQEENRALLSRLRATAQATSRRRMIAAASPLAGVPRGQEPERNSLRLREDPMEVGRIFGLLPPRLGGGCHCGAKSQDETHVTQAPEFGFGNWSAGARAERRDSSTQA
ncbi:uncharacterized protein A4U43_C07F26500 [Asparagus officinalis]|uniref:Uncharacterized protein n=1 Tax=Asparagus officinalis TaxID=4686 RepID=A0A5P1EHZ4_ASPOF|nr:uncharacterized protein A4U43_C07F26500 [Asparagus officinalis]